MEKTTEKHKKQEDKHEKHEGFKKPEGVGSSSYPEQAKKFQSNPFLLAFESMGRFFQHNLTWAIVLIVFATLGFIFNIGSNIADLPTDDSGSYETTTDYDRNGYGGSFVDEPSNFSESYDNSDVQASQIIGGILIVAGIVFVIFVVFFLLFATVDVLIKGMFIHVALESENAKKISLNEAWQMSLSKFWLYYKSYLLATLKIFGWTLLFIVPGIIASFRYALLPYVVLSDKSGKLKTVTDVHNRTKTLVHGRLFEVFGVGFVAGLVPIIGSVIGYSGRASLYNQLGYYHDHKLEKPKVHWLNYLFLGVIALMILLFISLIGLVVFFVASQS